MSSGTISVAVEWALWGKEQRDVEYRVLQCSNGTLGEKNFHEVLTRYTPGTLGILPQVAIGWLTDDKREKNYVYLAIHDKPVHDLYDASGREVVFTRCFCVPYAEIADGAVSYEAMYEKFCGIVAPRTRARAEFPARGQGAYVDARAMRVAAQLLTCKPVCIVGADHVGFAERLQFLDSVMALLPYGLRSRLSASTSVNSIFYEHKFRLFFSSARRAGSDDYQVTWGGQDDDAPITDSNVDRYLNWLTGNAEHRVAQLARRGNPVEFTRSDVAQELKQLYALPNKPPILERFRSRGVQPQVGPADQTLQLEAPAQILQPGTAEAQAIESLLIACDEEMRNDYSQVIVKDTIYRLSDHRNDQVTAEERQRYQQIIKDRDLLRDNSRFNVDQREIFYASLLAIAFGTPLTYEGYCQLEACAGYEPGQRINEFLLLAVDLSEVTDLRVRLLVLKGRGDEELKAAFRNDRKTLAELVQSAASGNRLLREHAQFIYQIVAWDLIGRPDGPDQKTLQSILHRWGYLAPTLDRIRHDQAAYQFTELRRLLQLSYGTELDRPAVRNILENTDSAPTYDLFLAVLSMTRPENTGLAERAFTRNVVLKRGYPDEARNNFLARLPDIDRSGPHMWNIRQRSNDRRADRMANGQPTQPQQPSGDDPDLGLLFPAQTIDEARGVLRGRQIKKAKHREGQVPDPVDRSARPKNDIRTNIIAIFVIVAVFFGIFIVALYLIFHIISRS